MSVGILIEQFCQKNKVSYNIFNKWYRDTRKRIVEVQVDGLFTSIQFFIMDGLQKYTAIVILNYNNVEDTINCINSVERYNTAPIKYIVVDNGSKREDAVSVLDAFFSKTFKGNYLRINDNYCCKSQRLPYISFIVSAGNDGYAQGNNKGLRLAYDDDDIDKVLILNNDILMVEDIIPKLTAALSTLSDAAIVSPVLYKKDMISIDYNCARWNPTNWCIILTYLFLYKDLFGIRSWLNRSRFILKCHPELMQSNHIEIELPSGSCMLFEKKLMDRIKIFDPNTFLYYEENILFRQIESIGGKNYLIPKLRCIHLGASSTTKVRNTFIVRCDLDSATYYLKTYGSMTSLQKLFMKLACLLFRMKITFLRLIGR